MKDKIDLRKIMLLTGAYCASLMGSGFATGQELMQFFTAHGYYGLAAGTIALVLFIWCGSKLMMYGFDEKENPSRNGFVHYMGRRFGKYFEKLTVVLMFIVVSIIISGAGAIFEEHFHFSKRIGSGIVTALMLVAVIMGLSSVINIIGRIAPVLICFSFLIGSISVINNFDGIARGAQLVSNLEILKTSKQWFVSGIFYGTFIMPFSVAFFSGMGATTSCRREAQIAGTLGSVIFISVAMVMNLGMLANIEMVYDKAVPTLALAQKISPALSTVFSVVLIISILSAGIPLLWTVCSKIAREGTKRYNITVVLLGAVAFTIGQFPFAKLVAFVFPIMGYLGCLFVAGMLRKELFVKKDTVKPSEKLWES